MRPPKVAVETKLAAGAADSGKTASTAFARDAIGGRSGELGVRVR